MDTMNLYYDYEQYLIGNTTSIPRYHFVPNHDDYNRRVVQTLIRYIVTNIFHWTIKEAITLFSKQVRNDFKLTPLVNKYYKMEKYLTEDEITLFLISESFPDVKFSLKRHTLSVYKAVCRNKAKYPPNFFPPTNVGLERAQICLRYMIDAYMPLMSTAEIYELFTEKGAATMLKNYKLDKPYKLYYKSPLDYLHDSTSRRDDFLYGYYKFTDALLKQKEEEKEAK